MLGNSQNGNEDWNDDSMANGPAVKLESNRAQDKYSAAAAVAIDHEPKD